MSDQDFMRLALDEARRGVGKGNSPFGACVVDSAGKVVCCAHNRVWQETDVTAHAEIVTLRGACNSLGRIDLTGHTIYSTTEPCPMCFSAIHWARVGRIVYGAGIADAAAAGFNELPVSNEQLKRLGGSGVEIVGGILREEAVRLFGEWMADPRHRIY
jgi:tRNA(Arg) A34 adenosine deaminase TadA